MNKIEKILILGAGINQLPLILKAKQRGLYVITVDNLPKNIGHKYSDEFLDISIEEKELIYSYMLEKKITKVISVCSDIGIRTYYYILNKLNLSNVDYKIVDKITKKNGLRYFLQEIGGNNLEFIEIKTKKEAKKIIEFIKTKKAILKPVDSSGSKGIEILEKNISEDEIEKKIEKSLKFSKNKILILEEYIQGKNVTVNLFLRNSKIIFKTITNKYLKENKIPIAHSLPSLLEEKEQKIIYDEVEKVIKKLEIKDGAFDFDFIITEDRIPYCIELSPRLGGNGIYNLVKEFSGFDEIEELLDIALDENHSKCLKNKPMPSILKLIVSNKNGVLKSINKIEFIKTKYKEIVEVFYDIEIGGKVEKFTQGNHRIGHILLTGNSIKDLEDKILEIEKELRLEIE